jgi:predicted AAA+ superfamily ATPase
MIARSCNILKFLDKNKSVFLFGARGTGKTSYLQTLRDSALSGSIYLDFLNNTTFRRYLQNPDLLIAEVDTVISQNQRAVIIIDEVQKIPAILDTVHLLIERHSGKAVFVLTGSSARKLKRGGANMLGGRAITNQMSPLAQSELDLALDRVLQYGSLPGIYLIQGLEVESLESYLDSYLRQEVLEEALVRKLDSFIRFLELAGQMNSEPINHAAIARQCKISANTVVQYYSILVDTLITYRIDGWHHSIRRQLMQAPKYYLFDCGVLNAINGELRTELKPHNFRYGKLFETFIIGEMFKVNSLNNLGLRFNYWRDQAGNEIDCIVSRSTAKPLVAIEIKSFTEPEPLQMSKLLNAEMPGISHWCFCNVPRRVDIGQVSYIPWRAGLEELRRM